MSKSPTSAELETAAGMWIHILLCLTISTILSILFIVVTVL